MKTLPSVLLGILLGGCASVSVVTEAPQLEGEWETQPSLAGLSLRIAPAPGGSYAVEWEAAGCLGNERGETTATVGGGRLTLREPITEYSGAKVSTFLLVRLQGQVLLFPEEPDLRASGANVRAFALYSRSEQPR